MEDAPINLFLELAMKRLGVLSCVLCGLILSAAGCTSDADKAQWAAFWKDVRGDNMKMRSDLSADK